MPAAKGGNLDLFWKLSESKDNARIEAAFKIVSNLNRLSIKDEKEEFLEDFAYSLRRFVSGLASDRINSRKGYFTALVQLVKFFPDEATVSKVMEIINKELNIKGTKSEEADYLCGRMLSFGALLRSEKVSIEEVGIIFQQLISISSKRSYFGVAAVRFIVDYLPKLSAEEFTNQIWPQISQTIQWKGDNAKLESFWLLLEINSAFPKMPPKDYMLEHFNRKKLLDDDLPEEVFNVLMNGSTNMRIMSQGPVFKGITNALSKSQPILKSFWLKISQNVDKTSTFKTTLAFGLMKLIIPLWPMDDLSSLMSPALADISLVILAKIESSTEEELMITSALESLTEKVKDQPQAQTDLIRTLLRVNVSYDKITGSSVVQKILTNASFETVQAAAELYSEALQGHGYTSPQRVYACHQLTKLLGHPKVHPEKAEGQSDAQYEKVKSLRNQWKTDIICLILTISQFEVKTPMKPLKKLPLPLTKETKHELKDVIFKALDTKSKTLEDTCSILLKVVEYADGLFKTNVQPHATFTPDAKKAWKNMMETIKKMTDPKKEDRVFQLLLIHIGFQLFSGDPGTLDLLSDLSVCYAKAKKGRSKAKDEHHWVEVVTDLMLSLLSQNRSVLRQVVNIVTSMLSPFMTKTALMTIMDVINNSDDDQEDMEEDEDDEFQPIDPEYLKNLQNGDGESEDDEDDEDEDEEEEGSDDEDSDNENEDEENKEPSDEFKLELTNAMGGNESDADSIDMDDLDDDAIAKLDTALGQVFKTMSGKKSSAEKRKEKKDALGQMHFKIRALDMIDNYLSHTPAISNVLVLSIAVIKALENVSKEKSQAPLEQRLNGTLRKLTALKKFEIDSNLEGKDLVDHLEALVEQGKSGSPVVAQLSHPLPLYAQLANLIVKVGNQMDDKKIDKSLKEVFVKAFDDFLNNT